jgi:hypothetical protein
MSRIRQTAALLLGCALLAACGGGTGQPGGTGTGAGSTPAGGKTRDVAFSECMRAHGVTNFPDPTSNGLQIPASINHQSPTFRSAQRACKQYLPNGGAPPATNPSERAAALAFARCMRAHGVPDFPDPALTPPRNAPSVFVLHGMVFAFSSPVDPKAPAFAHAGQACGLGKS